MLEKAYAMHFEVHLKYPPPPGSRSCLGEWAWELRWTSGLWLCQYFMRSEFKRCQTYRRLRRMMTFFSWHYLNWRYLYHAHVKWLGWKSRTYKSEAMVLSWKRGDALFRWRYSLCPWWGIWGFLTDWVSSSCGTHCSARLWVLKQEHSLSTGSTFLDRLMSLAIWESLGTLKGCPAARSCLSCIWGIRGRPRTGWRNYILEKL